MEPNDLPAPGKTSPPRPLALPDDAPTRKARLYLRVGVALTFVGLLIGGSLVTQHRPGLRQLTEIPLLAPPLAPWGLMGLIRECSYRGGPPKGADCLGVLGRVTPRDQPAWMYDPSRGMSSRCVRARLLGGVSKGRYTRCGLIRRCWSRHPWTPPVSGSISALVCFPYRGEHSQWMSSTSQHR